MTRTFSRTWARYFDPSGAQCPMGRTRGPFLNDEVETGRYPSRAKRRPTRPQDRRVRPVDTARPASRRRHVCAIGPDGLMVEMPAVRAPGRTSGRPGPIDAQRGRGSGSCRDDHRGWERARPLGGVPGAGPPRLRPATTGGRCTSSTPAEPSASTWCGRRRRTGTTPRCSTRRRRRCTSVRTAAETACSRPRSRSCTPASTSWHAWPKPCPIGVLQVDALGRVVYAMTVSTTSSAAPSPPRSTSSWRRYSSVTAR